MNRLRSRETPLLAAALAAIANLPYAFAWAGQGTHVFSGVLYNPLDGLSYLAKMRQGWLGEWLFRLPYTAQPGEGVFLYSYYLALGHLARWTGLSLETVYTGARLLAGVYFLLAAESLIGRLTASTRARRWTWLAFAFSSGLGWLAPLSDPMPPDLLVAESIPFLSLFSNSHFLLAGGLMFAALEAACPGLAPERPGWRRLAGAALAATLMAQVQPLALLTTGLTLAGAGAWHAWRARRLDWPALWPALAFGLAAMPWVIYDYSVLALHPVLSGWNAQNLTPSPGLGGALLWGGLPLALALPGAWIAARRRESRDVVALIWLGLGGLALYAPFALQRRLSLGLWLPLIVLAGAGTQALWSRLARRLRPLALALLIAGGVMSNALVIAATLGAASAHKPDLFLTGDEAAGLHWLRDNAGRGTLVLAGPEMGLFIPAWAGARVYYGHPFETVQAETRRAEVEAHFARGGAPADEVDYIFYGPREARLGPRPQPGPGWSVQFESGQVVIYGR